MISASRGSQADGSLNLLPIFPSVKVLYTAYLDVRCWQPLIEVDLSLHLLHRM